MAQFDYTGLTPDMILDAIESIGVYPQSGLLPLNSYENRVYQFVCDQGKRYVVKFYRPQRWSQQQIIEEHQYCQHLAQHDIEVVAPIVIDGSSLFEHQGFYFCLYPSQGGRMFEMDNLDQLEWLGRLVGRMHKSSQHHQFTSRLSINISEDLKLAESQLRQCELIPLGLQSTFFHDLAMLIELASQHSTAEFPVMQLHGDCHSGNVLLARDEAVLVDFDDCINGPAVQDIWMMLNGDVNEQRLQLDVFLEGYEEFCDFDRQQLKLIEPLRARRMVMYMAWLAQRWQDPAFPRNFAWFATEKYWEQQVLAIKEQIYLLSSPPSLVVTDGNC